MNIEQLGYLGFNSTDPAAFSQYATNTLGMQAVDLGTGRPSFRIDSYEQRVVVEPSDKNGAAYIGWQLADATGLRAAAGEVDATGVAVVRRHRKSSTSAASPRWCTSWTRLDTASSCTAAQPRQTRR
jgi:hypothetical protein